MKRIKLKLSGLIVTVCSLSVLCSFSAAVVEAGRQIYVTTEKAVYPYPIDEEIQVMGYLREVPAGTPVDIEISLVLPDGNTTWLNPDMEFHPVQSDILSQFPFVAVPAARLFRTDGTKIFNAGDKALKDLPAGRYVLRSVLKGNGVQDSSESAFFLVAEELLPSIAETPRPIIDALDPPWGASGTVVTVKGRNLRGMPELVDPALIDRFQIKVTLAGQELPIVDMDGQGQWLKVRLPAHPLTGDMVVDVTLPYWDLKDQEDQLPIPRVADYPSNAFPFWAAPEVFGVTSDAGVIPGGSIVLTGQNFSANATGNQVLFNGLPGTVTDSTNSTVTVTAPPISTTRAVAVEVVSNGIVGPPFYVYLATFSVDNWYPRTIVPGDSLTVQGRGFSETLEENHVFIGGVPMYVSAATATQLTVQTSGSLQQGVHPLEVMSRGVSVNIPEAVTVVPSW